MSQASVPLQCLASVIQGQGRPRSAPHAPRTSSLQPLRHIETLTAPVTSCNQKRVPPCQPQVLGQVRMPSSDQEEARSGDSARDGGKHASRRAEWRCASSRCELAQQRCWLSCHLPAVHPHGPPGRRSSRTTGALGEAESGSRSRCTTISPALWSVGFWLQVCCAWSAPWAGCRSLLLTAET